MDNLTHTLVGAALAETGLKRRSGLATATLMIAANLPDLDVLAIPLGENLTFRRGWTHGPVGLLLLPPLLALALVGWDRWQRHRDTRPPARAPVRPVALLLLAWLGALTHPFLDWLNSYGIRLLMPFSHTWYYGDALFIIDPWIWLALGGGIWLARRRGRGVGDPALPAQRPARVALLAVGAYVALMIVGSRAAERAALRVFSAGGGAPVERMMAGPAALDPLRRDLIFDTGEEYHTGVLRWRPTASVRLDPDPLPKGMDQPEVRRALERQEVRDFLYWSRFPYFTVEPLPGGAAEVQAADVRFQHRGRAGWARVRVTVDTD
jgi:inner membrane protein